MTTNFPTASSAYGLNGPSAAVTVEKSIHASHTEILTPPARALSANALIGQTEDWHDLVKLDENAIFPGGKPVAYWFPKQPT